MRPLAAFVTAAIFGGAIALSCGTVKPGCSAATCPGCCEGAVCQTGSMPAACGTSGVSCQRCAIGELCLIGQCSPLGAAGGGTTSAGGGGTSAGGGTTSAGGGTTSAGGGIGASCTNCQGCCDRGTCVTTTSASQCGANGAACSACNSNEICSGGVCSKCAGCFDLTTHACSPGTSSTSCGKGGGFCTSCGSGTCDNQACTCTAASCPNGCCAGGTCVDQTNYTDTQCGSGVAGAACVSCSASGRACSKSAGTCVDAGVVDSGFPNLDGGFDLCSLISNCAGKCCEINIFFPVCTAPGAACLNDAGVCDGATLKCK